jgi:hypothetical protein
MRWISFEALASLRSLSVFGLGWLGCLVVAPVMADPPPPVGSPPEPASIAHPWLATVPPDLARLVDVGQVSIAVDEEAVQAARRSALTLFQFSIAYRMHYRLQPLPPSPPQPPRVRLSVRFFDLRTDLVHRILLSEKYRPPQPWVSPLLQHEFDHVAISSDPRLLALIQSLADERQQWTVEVAAQTATDRLWVEGQIRTYVANYQKSLEDLVNSYYQQLDAASAHGQQMLGDRARFFLGLYTEQSLAVSPFSPNPWRVRALKAVPVDEVRRHYRLP